MIASSETLCGVLVVDKPSGWTSHDVVAKLRRITGIKKIGHLGTLDPIATGVLPLLVGRATRLAQLFVRNDKVYEGTIRFGYATDTYDADGTPITPVTEVQLDYERVSDLLKHFRGKLAQVPPPISAKKVGGQPAYKLARQNIAVELRPVDVEVYSLEVQSCGGSELAIRVHCGSGTYIRSLAHDLGQRVGCGAFLQSLRRTASGVFTIESARTLDELQQLSHNGLLSKAVISASGLLPEIPTVVVDPAAVTAIRQGREFRTSPFGPSRGSRLVKAVSPEGDLVAIGEGRLPNLYHPMIVL